jgi:hypothetical protein
MTPDFDKIADKLVSVWPDADALRTNIRAALEDAYNAGLEDAAGVASAADHCCLAPAQICPSIIADAVRARKIVKEG